MARPHIEFVQSQNIAWEDQADGSAIKLLSVDPDSAERTWLCRAPQGWTAPAWETAVELFVLEGGLRIGETDLPRHGYAFVPPGAAAITMTAAATLLICQFSATDPAGTGPLQVTDAAAMPWDTSTLDEKLVHLRLARKILRLGPGESGRTYLLTGLPHGRPPQSDMAIERHPHAEEMFLVHGEMSAPEGVMTTGAYFYRPAGIDHGPHISDFGFLMFMRTPGAARIVTEWREQRRPLPIDAPYRPVLPPGTPEDWAAERAVRPSY